MKLSEQLVELRETWGLTFLVFTHEKKNDVRPGYTARGAIGIISGNAGSVWSLKDEFELLQEAKIAARATAKEQLIAAREKALAEKASKRPIFEVVHENKTYGEERGNWIPISESNYIPPQNPVPLRGFRPLLY